VLDSNYFVKNNDTVIILNINIYFVCTWSELPVQRLLYRNIQIRSSSVTVSNLWLQKTLFLF